MARRLGLSARTLQRRLTAQGRSYQVLVDEVRTTLASEYLAHTTMSVEEVGQRLGFSEATNFRKAFRKWTGQAPAVYRSRHAPDGSLGPIAAVGGSQRRASGSRLNQ